MAPRWLFALAALGINAQTDNGSKSDGNRNGNVDGSRGTTAPWLPEHFTRARFVNSLVVDDMLVVDYNEIYMTINPPKPYAGDELYGSTLMFNLTETWTPSSIRPAVKIIKSMGYPFSRQPLFWYNPVKHSISTFGGWQYDHPTFTYGIFYPNRTIYPSSFSPQPATTMWTLNLARDISNSVWSIAEEQPPEDVRGIPGQLMVSTPNELLALGGSQDYDYAGTLTGYVAGPAYAIPGLVRMDYSTSTWVNNTAKQTSNPFEYNAQGEGMYIPSFGQKGVALFFGGYAPKTQWFENGVSRSDLFFPLSTILVYDIASNTFANQTATGDIPGTRWGFCVVGVEDKASGGFDIFLYGGFAVGEQLEEYIPSYAKVYVLSIPSFVWTELPDSAPRKAQMRGSQTCQVIGKSQMVVIGGDDPTRHEYGWTPDPFTNAIGLFDLNNLEWKFTYDPKAAAYKRSYLLSSRNKNPLNHKWDNRIAQKIFTGHAPPLPSSGPDTGAIAGGVVGGVVGLALIIGLTSWFIKRRRQRRAFEAPALEEGKSSGSVSGSAELHGTEKPIPQELETPVSPFAKELEASSKRQELETLERPQHLDSPDEPEDPTLAQQIASMFSEKNREKGEEKQEMQELPG